MAMSPTQVALAKMKKENYPLVQIVETFNFHAGVRKDLFTFIDILAITEEGQVVAVQVTSKSNMGARIKKIADSESVKYVRKAGWKILVWGTYKQNNRWQIKEVDVS